MGVAAFGVSFAALILAAAIYVSSSAITVKGLIDFRRLADDETDLVLAILVAEDIVIALVLGFAAGGGGAAAATLAIVAKAVGFIAVSLAVSKWLAAADRPAAGLAAARVLPARGVRLPDRDGRGRRRARPLRGDRRADGRRRPLRDLDARGDRGALLQLPRRLRRAVLLRLRALDRRLRARRASAGSLAARRRRRRWSARSRRATCRQCSAASRARQSFNAGVALIAHGEFTDHPRAGRLRRTTQLSADQQAKLVAFAGLYVLVTATIGVILMKESKVLGRRLFRAPTLAEGG